MTTITQPDSIATLLVLLRTRPHPHPRDHVAESPPRPGTRYNWDCGCTFIYAAGGWRERQVCGWHAERWEGVESRG